LREWIDGGGIVLTEGATSSVFTDYGVTNGVDIAPARQLPRTEGIYRAVIRILAVDRLRVRGYGRCLLQPVAAAPGGYEHGRPGGPGCTADRRTARARPRVVFELPSERFAALSGAARGRRGAWLAARGAPCPVGRGRRVVCNPSVPGVGRHKAASPLCQHDSELE